MNNKIKYCNFTIIISTFFALLWSYPYVFSRLTISINLTLLYLIVISFMFVAINNVKSKKTLPKSFFVICCLQFFVFFLLFLVHQDSFYILRHGLFVIIAYFMLWAIHNSISIEKFVKYNCLLVSLQALLGMVSFILFYVGVIQPLMEISGGGERTAYFMGLTCTNVMVGNIIRPSGFFDEPGALAFWGVYSLLFNQLFIKNKYVNIFLIVGLIFTLSMYYYIVLPIFLILFYRKYRMKLLMIFLLLFSIYSYIQKYEGDTSDLYRYTIKRFEQKDSGNFETNRDDALETGYKYFLMRPIFGHGKTNLENKEVSVEDAPFENLAHNGIIGTIIIYSPLLLLLFKSKHKDIKFACIILFISYLQRPFHIQLIHYLFLYTFFLMSLQYNSKQINHENYS